VSRLRTLRLLLPTDALRAWGLCRIERDNCTDCLICVDYCPADALEVIEESRV